MTTVDGVETTTERKQHKKRITYREIYGKLESIETVNPPEPTMVGGCIATNCDKNPDKVSGNAGSLLPLQRTLLIDARIGKAVFACRCSFDSYMKNSVISHNNNEIIGKVRAVHPLLSSWELVVATCVFLDNAPTREIVDALDRGDMQLVVSAIPSSETEIDNVVAVYPIMVQEENDCPRNDDGRAPCDCLAVQCGAAEAHPECPERREKCGT